MSVDPPAHARYPAILVTDYDPDWPSAFFSAQQRLATLLGADAVDICHVGSTAIPGLCAKPKIDIDIVLRTSALIPGAIDSLKDAGYTFHGNKYNDGMWAFTTGHGSHGERIYLCAPGNATHQKRLFFRDYLRSTREASTAYAALKRRLASETQSDWDHYTGGKGPFVKEITCRAAIAGICAVTENRRSVTEAVLRDIDTALPDTAHALLLDQVEDLPMVACIAPDGESVAFASFMRQTSGEVAIHFSGVRRSWQGMGLSHALVEAVAGRA